MNRATIIYYTSNREDPGFEKRVQENLLKVSGGLPIISVSQKPIKLGKNICVGDVGVSGFNMFRQVQIACKAAKSKFVISAEADCLYPPDYFKFIPPFNEGDYPKDWVGLKVCKLSMKKGERLEDFLNQGVPKSEIMYLHSWRFNNDWYTFDVLEKCLQRLENANE